MIAVVRKKLCVVRSEARAAMMGNTPGALKASGRFAACNTLLNGGLPKMLAQGLEILPDGWMQREGWEEIIDQFSGLIEEPERKDN